jgi:hypothetical protein
MLIIRFVFPFIIHFIIHFIIRFIFHFNFHSDVEHYADYQSILRRTKEHIDNYR